jgi:hypothetical protein
LEFNNPLNLGKWKSIEARREFFVGFAKAKNFDPLDAAKWNTVTVKDINAEVSCLDYYVIQ